MAAPTNRPPRRGGSHFAGGSQGGAHAGDPTPHAPAGPSTQARAPRSALAGGRVSSRTAAATQRAGSGNVRRQQGGGGGGRVAAIVGAVVAALAVVGLAVFVVVPALTGGSQGDATQEVVPGNQVTITIPEGSGAAAVADLLFDNGVIANKSEFLAQVRRTEAESSLKPGAYSLTTGADLTSIIELLTAGPNASTAQLVIPEGYTLAQIAATVEESLGISASDFTAQAMAANYVGDYAFLADAGDGTLEGYLFPKTYDFSGQSDLTADAVIRAMLDQYQAEVAGIDFSASAAQIQSRYGVTMSEHDIITLASIIEREAGSDEHRADVASVFYNRLSTGMNLQSDATLVYELGRDVTAADLEVDSAYNTYTRAGLTPTPICSPGLASIQAACNPNDTSYYYFFLSGDYSAFSETLAEHEAAIANRPQE